MPKAKTLKQLKAASKALHSHLYNTDRFKYRELTGDEYNNVLTREDKKAYIALHTKSLPPHQCGYCLIAHVLGGYCSEDEDWITPAPPSTRRRED